MLFSVSTNQGSTSRADQAHSYSGSFSRPASLFPIKNLLGCGYVGNKDVVHISTVWACGPCG
jgi:hypothetical protein